MASNHTNVGRNDASEVDNESKSDGKCEHSSSPFAFASLTIMVVMEMMRKTGIFFKKIFLTNNYKVISSSIIISCSKSSYY